MPNWDITVNKMYWRLQQLKGETPQIVNVCVAKVNRFHTAVFSWLQRARAIGRAVLTALYICASWTLYGPQEVPIKWTLKRRLFLHFIIIGCERGSDSIAIYHAAKTRLSAFYRKINITDDGVDQNVKPYELHFMVDIGSPFALIRFRESRLYFNVFAEITFGEVLFVKHFICLLWKVGLL